jgi:hypothetical protein
MTWAKAEDMFHQQQVLSSALEPRQKRGRGHDSAPTEPKDGNQQRNDGAEAKPEPVLESCLTPVGTPEAKPRRRRVKEKRKAAAAKEDVNFDVLSGAQPKRPRGRPRGSNGATEAAQGPLGGLTSAQKANTTYHPFLEHKVPIHSEATESERDTPGSGKSSTDRRSRGRPSLPPNDSFVVVPIPADGYDTVSEDEEEDPESAAVEGASTLQGDTLNVTHTQYDGVFEWIRGTSEDTRPERFSLDLCPGMVTFFVTVSLLHPSCVGIAASNLASM